MGFYQLYQICFYEITQFFGFHKAVMFYYETWLKIAHVSLWGGEG